MVTTASDPDRRVGHGQRRPAAIRAVDAHPGLVLAAAVVANPDKVGRDAGDARRPRPRPRRRGDRRRRRGAGRRPGAVVYAASGDVRPDDARGRRRRGAPRPARWSSRRRSTRSTTSASAPAALREPLVEAATEGGGALFVSGIDPGWGNDVLPILMTGLAGTIESVRCQEIFDYTTYDQPDAVRNLIGMGRSMDEVPMMVAPSVPTMVWGGQVRLMARALGVELDEIRETLDRRALEADGRDRRAWARSTPAPRAVCASRSRASSAASRGSSSSTSPASTRRVAPDWPVVADGGAGAHTVIIEGRPRIEVTVAATDEGGNRAAGGNATAVARLVNAIPWLRAAPPGALRRARRPAHPGHGPVGALLGVGQALRQRESTPPP